MRVLVLASQKGGSGKSTLAASLAVVAWQAGERVVVVDLDPQKSLTEWGNLRKAGGIVFRAVSPGTLDKWMTDSRKVPAITLVIVDTAGTFGKEVDTALKHADLCLVPVRPSAFDLRAAKPTVDRLRELSREFAFVLNGTNPIAQARTAEAIENLQVGGAVAPPVAERTDFRDSVASGLGVTEINSTGKAAAEIRALWGYVDERMPVA